MLGIFVLSSSSTLPSPPDFDGFDKIEHFLAYSVLSMMFLIAIRGTWTLWRPSATGALAILITAAYGGTDEFHQRFVPGRSCDSFDWIADLLGAIIGTGSLLLFLYLKNRRNCIYASEEK
jgi:VanZ family protein